MIVQKAIGSLICKEIATAGGDVLAYLSIPYARAGRFEIPVDINLYNKSPINREETLCFPQKGLHTKLNVLLKHHMMRDEWSVKWDIQTEDAFVVNIWTRKNPDHDPVLIFLHGSGEYNSGTTPLYNGANLAAKGVVVVTVTYRIGNFGYLPVFDEDRLIANLCYRDQQAALRWVRRHIAEFGGDDTRITLMGHSGGALSVHHHYLNEESSKYFDQCMMLGGPIPNIKKDEGLREQFYEMLHANRCKSLSDLKALDAKNIIRLKKASMKEVLDGDFFPEPSEELLKRSAFSPKPLLIGSNTDELSMIELPMFYKAMGIATRERNVDEALRKTFGEYADLMRSAFESESDGIIDLQIKCMEAASFHYAAYRLMKIYGEKSPVYGYRMGYVPNLYHGLRGAYHGAEVALFFDNLDKMNIEITPENRKQAQKLQEDWIAFLRTGEVPGLSPFREGGKILSYEKTASDVIEFPHASLMELLDTTEIPEKMMNHFLSKR